MDGLQHNTILYGTTIYSIILYHYTVAQVKHLPLLFLSFSAILNSSLVKYWIPNVKVSGSIPSVGKLFFDYFCVIFHLNYFHEVIMIKTLII